MFLAHGETLRTTAPAFVASTYGYDNLEEVSLSLAETVRS